MRYPESDARHMSGKLDRQSPVPLYHQLERALLEFIAGSRLAPDALFPSETELAARFGVTRPTVRQALERLVQVGVLRKERGRGTYVATIPDRAQDPDEQPTVKVIMPSLTDLIHLRVLSGIVDEAHSRGIRVLLAQSGNRSAVQERELAATAGCAGVILWPTNDATSVALDALDVPVIFLDRYLDLDHDHVVVDDVGGAGAVTDHLAGLGHRRIAFIHAESRRLSSIKGRLSGYRTSLQNNALEYDRSLVVRTGGAIERALDELLAIADPPTAAFCVNDVIAVQAFTALRHRGVDIPGEFSVAGFDALEVLPASGRLTSVRRATEQMGRRGMTLMAARLRNPTGRPQHVEFPTELIVGDTTAPLCSTTSTAPGRW